MSSTSAPALEVCEFHATTDRSHSTDKPLSLPKTTRARAGFHANRLYADWAIEFANLHPEVRVIGTDLSPIQPDWIPSNCEFFVDDAAKPWVFHERFDYVHTRALAMGIADWDHIIDQGYKVLQPGGFIEMQELSIPLVSPDGTVVEGSALWTWGRKVRDVCGRLGIDSEAAVKHADRLRARGFENVHEVHLLCPLGPWAKGQREKRLGYMARKDLYEGIDAISKRLFIAGGDSAEQVDLFLARCKEELLDPSVSRPWGVHPHNLCFHSPSLLREKYRC